jgi:hypothetical protein
MTFNATYACALLALPAIYLLCAVTPCTRAYACNPATQPPQKPCKLAWLMAMLQAALQTHNNITALGAKVAWVPCTPA